MRGAGGRPVGELAHVLLGHLLAVAVAQHRLQHDADRHRQARDLRHAGRLERGQRVVVAGGAGGELQFLERAKEVVGHRRVLGSVSWSLRRAGRRVEDVDRHAVGELHVPGALAGPARPDPLRVHLRLAFAHAHAAAGRRSWRCRPGSWCRSAPSPREVVVAVDSPSLHTLSMTKAAPSARISCLLHATAPWPSCFARSSVFSSMHSCAPGAGGDPGTTVVTSHRPALAPGKVDALRRPPPRRAAIHGHEDAGSAARRERSDHHQVDELVHRHRSSSFFASSATSRMACCCFAGKRRARLVRNFSTSTGMPSSRRRRWPIGYSTTTSRVRLPSLNSTVMRVGDRALVRVEVVPGELRVLDAGHLVAQRVDARVRGDVVLVVGGGEPAEDQRHGDHVLDAVVAVGRVVERALLVDDADRRLVRARSRSARCRRAGRCTCGCSCIAHSTAVCAWNSAGKEILNSTFSIT